MSTFFQTIHDHLFNNIHGSHLIYNACWEDPRIDRQLLNLDKNSKVVMITSAGCNALDYLLDAPAEIHAVDMNPRQNALCELKLRLIETVSFTEIFALFGQGYHLAYQELYAAIRNLLSKEAQAFWDKKLYYFDHHNLKRTFYYHGASGHIAWLLRHLLNLHKKLGRLLWSLLEAPDLETQQHIYDHLEPTFWTSFSRWVVQHPLLLAMIGVPRAQIGLIAQQHPEGIVGYIRECFKRVATEVVMYDNYFWRVYLTGAYTQRCCPNYLKAENFDFLRVHTYRVQTHTATLTQFLHDNPGTYTHFVLLDHQDWMAWADPAALAEEWELILQNSRPGSKVLLRSADNMDVSFLPPVAKSAVRFFPERTIPLHRQDRVGTYRSLHLAEVL